MEHPLCLMRRKSYMGRGQAAIAKKTLLYLLAACISIQKRSVRCVQPRRCGNAASRSVAWGEERMKKTLTKADIVEAIYEETDKNRVDVKNVVEKLLEIMKSAIKKDRALLISGFGKFECYDKASRKGRNPKTDETITLPPRKVMVFRLSRKLRAELNP
jgi:integration host factor subunit alpha